MPTAAAAPTAVGGAYSCTITNTDQAATLTVTKHVVNNNGGTASASDFPITVAGTAVAGGSTTFAGSETGTTVSLSAGTYTVSETSPGGYTESDLAGCAGPAVNGGGLQLHDHQHRPGRHPDRDEDGRQQQRRHAQPRRLHDHRRRAGRTAHPVRGRVRPATTCQPRRRHLHGDRDQPGPGYTTEQRPRLGCTGGPANGGAYSCTITNNDQAAVLTVTKTVVNNTTAARSPAPTSRFRPVRPWPGHPSFAGD